MFNSTSGPLGSNYGSQQTGGYAAEAAPPVETPSHIRDGLSNAEQLVSGVREMISALEKRLDTVLRPSAPTPNSTQASEAKAGPVRSHVAGRIDILNDALTQAGHRLQELGGRVEV